MLDREEKLSFGRFNRLYFLFLDISKFEVFFLLSQNPFPLSLLLFSFRSPIFSTAWCPPYPSGWSTKEAPRPPPQSYR